MIMEDMPYKAETHNKIISGKSEPLAARNQTGKGLHKVCMIAAGGTENHTSGYPD